MTAFQLGAEPLTIEAAVAIARHRRPVEAPPSTRARIEASRAVILRHAAADKPVYGLTTSLGAGVDTRLTVEDQHAFQQRVPRARAVGVGPRMPAEQARALLLVRAAGIAAGGVGCSIGLFDALLAALNAGLDPVLPSLGSIGCGDLAQLAQATLCLMGEGECAYQGVVLPAPEALSRAGLRPLVLDVKDGHAMISVNGQSVGHACLTLVDAARSMRALEAATALTFEGYRAGLTPLDPRAQAARPSPGAPETAARLLALLEGASLLTPDPARKVHEAVSFRSVTQIHGAAMDTMARARALTEVELNHTADNPVVLPADDLVLHNSNFDITALTLAFETLCQALSHVSTAACWRAMKLMSPGFSGLPRFLTPMGQNRSGFATVQKTLSALDMEIRHLAQPASLAPLPVADGQEDAAQMAPLVVAKCATIVDRLTFIAAISLIAAAQACDLRPVPRATMGRGTGAAYDLVRALVAPLADDRAQGPDFDRLAAAIAAGDLDRALTPGT